MTLFPANPVVGTAFRVSNGKDDNVIRSKLECNVVGKSIEQAPSDIPARSNSLHSWKRSGRCENSYDCLLVLIDELFAQSTPLLFIPEGGLYEFVFGSG